MANSGIPTNQELLVRLDERVKTLSEQMAMLQQTLISPAEHKILMQGYRDFDEKIGKLEVRQGKIEEKIARYVALASVFGGSIVSLAYDFIKSQLHL
jgi:hypothetical protein